MMRRMSGIAFVELFAVALLGATAWLAKRSRVRISTTISVMGLIVTIFMTVIIGGAAQKSPEQISFFTYAAIYLGGVALSLVFTVLIFAGRWQSREGATLERGTKTLVRGAPASRRRS